jgi:outer membrane protein assembly factor BamB
MSRGTDYDKQYSRYEKEKGGMQEAAGAEKKSRYRWVLPVLAVAAVAAVLIGWQGSRLWQNEKTVTEASLNADGNAKLQGAAAQNAGVQEGSSRNGASESGDLQNADLQSDDGQNSDQEDTEITKTAALETEAEEEPEFNPHCTEATDPANLIASTEVMVNDVYYDYISDYYGEREITFGTGSQYTDVEGVITFRGNNFRNNPTYGYANLTDYTLNEAWSKTTGGLTYKDATWTGSGWTGQPLLMKWPAQTKANMNMYDWAKQDEDLVEVIYACMDGYVYFLDLRTGEATRDALYLGYTFKGAGALDPRGYPILYVGAGYDSNEGTARAFVINLLDCSVMYTFGNNDSFSLRGNLSYFDSSALVDAETDTLIYPGENGILYLIRLNTQYDEEAGTLSIDPDRVVRWRYQGVRTSTYSYWLGMEDSAAIYQGYLFVADNGGNLMCLNLNTMELVWVQDILDDSNSTPVLSVEDGHLYLYVSTSFHLGWRSSTTATIPIWKIDAETGEIVWQTDYECYTQDGVSGGVQSTIATGSHALSDYIYVTVAMTENSYSGELACLDKKTGEKVWEHSAYYAWSSPVCVYNADGTGSVLYCSCDGLMYLLDGTTGEVQDTFTLSNGAVEASPAVYENYVVVGTRASRIWGIQLQ